MEIILKILLVLAVLLLLFIVWAKPRRKIINVLPLSDSYRNILQEQVEFYRQLEDVKKRDFENRLQLFLAQTKITGVGTTVEDLDRVLVASSAIIPIFGFPGWEYVNLREVLLYPGQFNHDFEQTGNDRTISGMVGSGALNGVMVLSQWELRQAFLNKTGKTNTAIHEFVHLVDKTDGAADGIPAFILQQPYILPWLQFMREEIERIRRDQSDINPYGSTNEAEFFAVVSEYFFERPDLLEEKHPELFHLLSMIFRQKPGRGK